MDLASLGSSISKTNPDLYYLKPELIEFKPNEKEEIKETIEKPKKEEQLSMDSFLNDFKI